MHDILREIQDDMFRQAAYFRETGKEDDARQQNTIKLLKWYLICLISVLCFRRG